MGDNYVLLIRAHYAVAEKLNLMQNDFVKDVSDCLYINDLYSVSDILFSD